MDQEERASRRLVVSELRLKLECLNGKAEVKDAFFTAPLKIGKPFRHPSHTEIMLMQASAGMLDGDINNMAFDVGDNCNALITTQSYSKIFKANGIGAAQNINVRVGSGASLLWLPLPVIPFARSVFKSRINVTLVKASRLVLCDIISCGRVGGDERFQFDLFSSRIAIHVDGKLAFLDYSRLSPSEMHLPGIGFFEGRTHIGLIYAYGCNEVSPLECINAEWAMSRAASGNVIRVLSDRASDIYDFAKEFAHRALGF
jgi:urease accessory protein